ncbi:hypothetical protein C2I36_12955 [Rhodobacteraceae bacterium WD3A24]|nr:hypothetical protein C2I36_12955 [Rhodobacteraceae bacterium WD3A24]
MTDQTVKRAAPISYRPPKDREDEFRARVAASGLSVNAFLTESVFGRTRHRPGELKALARLLGRAAHIRDNLHEISMSAGGDDALVIEAAMDELAEIRAALLDLMGRKS